MIRARRHEVSCSFGSGDIENMWICCAHVADGHARVACWTADAVYWY
eukprot:COSAG01_NODE_67474_length_267_cov_0.559524_1_plen_46_part_10